MRKISCRLSTYRNIIQIILRWFYKILLDRNSDGEALLSLVCLKAPFTVIRELFLKLRRFLWNICQDFHTLH